MDALDLVFGVGDGEIETVLHRSHFAALVGDIGDRLVDSGNRRPGVVDRVDPDRSQVEVVTRPAQIFEIDLNAVDKTLAGSDLKDAAGTLLNCDGGATEIAVRIASGRAGGIGTGERDLEPESVEVGDDRSAAGARGPIEQRPDIQRLGHRAIAER